jgi:cellulose synthase/poly-beta-1,6-N-acetylglucosamine synthase-like glycosyltransferase
VVNHLAQLAKQQLSENSIFVLTDANVILEKDCVFEMVKHFKNNNIGLVGANILNTKNDNMVGELESMYISRENKMKLAEGLFHGALMGAFGACYAIRSACYKIVPDNFLMEDFFITMQVHNQQLECIFETKAIAYEDVPGNMWEEFKRKSRIATGNFQNLFFFKHWLLKPFTAVGFTFISHKVLRWATPFLAITGLILVGVLAIYSDFYEYIFLYKFIFWALFLIDALLVAINIHIKPLRLLTYFYFMNVAIIVGFFKYLKGIRSAAWQSTKRKV